jgi:hypothetical protein
MTVRKVFWQFCTEYIKRILVSLAEFLWTFGMSYFVWTCKP